MAGKVKKEEEQYKSRSVNSLVQLQCVSLLSLARIMVMKHVRSMTSSLERLMHENCITFRDATSLYLWLDVRGLPCEAFARDLLSSNSS